MFCVLILGIASVLLGTLGSSAVAVTSIGFTWIGICFILWNVATTIAFISFLTLHPAAQQKPKPCRIAVTDGRLRQR